MRRSSPAVEPAGGKCSHLGNRGGAGGGEERDSGGDFKPVFCLKAAWTNFPSNHSLPFVMSFFLHLLTMPSQTPNPRYHHSVSHIHPFFSIHNFPVVLVGYRVLTFYYKSNKKKSAVSLPNGRDYGLFPDSCMLPL